MVLLQKEMRAMTKRIRKFAAALAAATLALTQISAVMPTVSADSLWDRWGLTKPFVGQPTEETTTTAETSTAAQTSVTTETTAAASAETPAVSSTTSSTTETTVMQPPKPPKPTKPEPTTTTTTTLPQLQQLRLQRLPQARHRPPQRLHLRRPLRPPGRPQHRAAIIRLPS